MLYEPKHTLSLRNLTCSPFHCKHTHAHGRTCGRAMDSCLWRDSFSWPSSRRRSWAVPRLSCVSLRFSSSLSLSVSMLTISDSRFPVLPPSSPPPLGSLPLKPPPPIAPPEPPTPAPAGEEGPPPVPLRPSSEMVGITSHIIMRPWRVCVKLMKEKKN